MIDAIEKWWPFAAFVMTGVIGWFVGQERNRWKINDLGNAMQRLEGRVGALETQGRAEGMTLASIGTTLTAMDRTLSEIKADLKGKVDKP